MSLKNLDILFDPQRIAVVGASEDKKSVGYHALKNLIGKGYTGIVHPVSRCLAGVQGIEAHRNIKDIPHPIDLAIVAAKPDEIVSVLKDCGEKRVKGVTILAPDHIHDPKHLAHISEQVRKLPARYGCRVLGTNSFGFMRPSKNLNASLYPEMVRSGNIAFISESGIFSSAFLEHAINKNVGFSYFVSLGSKLDINIADIVDFLGGDSSTRAIFLYLQTINNGRKFMTSIRNFAKNRLVVVVKPGKSDVFSLVTANSKESPVEDDLIYDAVFKRAGSLRVHNIADLLSMVETIAKQQRPKGKRLLIISNSVAPSKMAIDALKELDGLLAEPSEKTLTAIHNSLSAKRELNNPLYLQANASAADYKVTIENCLGDKGVDGVLVICIPFPGVDLEKIAEAIVIAAKTNRNTPIFSTWFGEKTASAEIDFLNNNGIPTYSTTMQAVKSFMYMYGYDYNLKLLQETPRHIIKNFSPDLQAVDRIIKVCSDEKRFMLRMNEALEILKAYGIKVVESIRVTNNVEAVAAAHQLGFPVVMKIVSESSLKKPSAGKVFLHLLTDEEVEDGFLFLQKDAISQQDPTAEIILQPQFETSGYQLTIGAKKSVSFGTVILFGLGGAHLKAVKDYSIGLPPLNQTLARRMMEETKIYRHLQDSGTYQRALHSLEELLVRFSQLIVDLPQIGEININPLLLTEREGIVRDVNIYLDTKLPKEYRWKKGDLCPLHLSIPPYPFKYEKRAELRDGTVIKIRPVRGEDEPILQQFFEFLSPETVYFRFGLRRINVPHDILARLCQLDYDRDFGFLAVVKEEGKEDVVIGDVRLNRFANPDHAEFSFVVADQWQGRGMGTILMDYCMALAEDIGIKTIHMEILKENKSMINFASKYHFNRIPSSRDDDMEEMVYNF